MRAWILSAVVPAVAATTGCGLVPEMPRSIVPLECNFPPDSTIVWAGTGSLAGLGLEIAPEFDFPAGATADVYVRAQPANLDQFCAVLDAGTQAQRTITGITPEGWEPPNSSGAPS